jgi:hypothetical protein
MPRYSLGDWMVGYFVGMFAVVIALVILRATGMIVIGWG